jgi:hypothetical protein
MVMPGVKATPEDISKSLEGNRREELLFALRHTGALSILSGEKSPIKTGSCETPGVVGGPK